MKRTTTHAGTPTTTIDLIGTAGGQRITIKGSIVGEGDDPGINLRVTGANVPIDETLFAAFPAKYARIVRQFRAAGRGDFIAEINQQPGVNLCENEFRLDIRDATANYEQFPYPLEKIKGRLVVRVTATDPTRPVRPGEPLVRAARPRRDRPARLHGGPCRRGGVAQRLEAADPGLARSEADPARRRQRLPDRQGHERRARQAQRRVALDDLRAEGKLSFAADVELIDRAPPLDKPDHHLPINPATDLKMTFNFSGPSITPTFFPYAMTDLAGWLEYKNNRIDLRAHRGAAR